MPCVPEGFHGSAAIHLINAFLATLCINNYIGQAFELLRPRSAGISSLRCGCVSEQITVIEMDGSPALIGVLMPNSKRGVDPSIFVTA
jgi:hypothetical protein